MTSAVPQPAPPPAMQLIQMGVAYWTSRALHVAAELGIADLLKDGPRDVAFLAAQTQTHPDALYRILRSLSSVGVFIETNDHTFALTPLSECMRSDVPGSARPLLLFMADDVHWKSYAEMKYSVRTGNPAFDHVFGKPIFDHFAATPADAQRFDDAMTSNSAASNSAFADAYDFSSLKNVADIAGGKGSLLGMILAKAPQARGILFDMPHVIEAAKSAGFLPADRTEYVAGDFFQSVPAGADAYIMKHIIHDWNDEQASRILQACRRAASPSSKLLLFEAIISEQNEPSLAALMDLEMLVLPGGLERTVDQYRALLGGTGFQLTRVIPTASPLSIIEAVPA